MNAKIQSLFSAAVLAVAALTVSASSASAAIYYSWSGSCSFNCSGNSTATLELRDSYVGGANLVYDDFISFSYNSTSGSFDVPGHASLSWISGVLPARGTSGATNLVIDFSGWLTYQVTSATGGWHTAFVRTGVFEGGTGGTWSNVGGGTVDLPAPGSLLAMLGALLALAFVRRFGRQQPGLAAQA